MKASENAIQDGIVNPLGRLAILFFGTWLIGAVYPVPETIYHLVIGPQSFGNVTITHGLRWFDFRFIPILSAFISETFLVSGPTGLFCIVCSAMDRWDWRKVTALSGFSTFSMLILETTVRDSSWMIMTGYQALATVLILILLRQFR